MGVIGAIVGLLFYVNSLDLIGKNYFTSNLSGLLLIIIIGFTLVFFFCSREKIYRTQNHHFRYVCQRCKQRTKTGVTIFPYVMGMLVAISFSEIVVCLN